MRATFQNSGTAVSIGVFFSLMIAGLAGSLPHTLTAGLEQQGVPAHIATQVGELPPGSPPCSPPSSASTRSSTCSSPAAPSPTLTAAQQHALTGSEFFPTLISGPPPLRPGRRVRPSAPRSRCSRRSRRRCESAGRARTRDREHPPPRAPTRRTSATKTKTPAPRTSATSTPSPARTDSRRPEVIRTTGTTTGRHPVPLRRSTPGPHLS
ncbi:hypothetical protein ACRAWF_16275 [Streptomyces sp. L7]